MNTKLNRLLGRETQISERPHKGTLTLQGAREPRYAISVITLDEAQ